MSTARQQQVGESSQILPWAQAVAGVKQHMLLLESREGISVLAALQTLWDELPRPGCSCRPAEHGCLHHCALNKHRSTQI